MDQITALKLLLIPGISLILIGTLLIAGYGTLEYVGTIYTIVGIVAIIFGALWVWKVDKVAKRLQARAKSRSMRRFMVLVLLALLTITLLPLKVSYLQQQAPECQADQICRTMYIRVLYIEYVVVALLIIAGFLAFGPIIFGRTILGPILAEFQYIAGAMLALLIFILLLTVPIHVMFEFSSGCCEIKVSNLESRGPILLQILLKLIVPPMPPA